MADTPDLLDQVAGEQAPPPTATPAPPQQTTPSTGKADLLDQVDDESRKQSGTTKSIAESTKSWWDFANEGTLSKLEIPGTGGKTVGQAASGFDTVLT